MKADSAGLCYKAQYSESKAQENRLPAAGMKLALRHRLY